MDGSCVRVLLLCAESPGVVGRTLVGRLPQSTSNKTKDTRKKSLLCNQTNWPRSYTHTHRQKNGRHFSRVAPTRPRQTHTKEKMKQKVINLHSLWTMTERKNIWTMTERMILPRYSFDTHRKWIRRLNQKVSLIYNQRKMGVFTPTVMAPSVHTEVTAAPNSRLRACCVYWLGPFSGGTGRSQNIGANPNGGNLYTEGVCMSCVFFL